MSISSLLLFGLAGLVGVSFFVVNPFFERLRRLVVHHFGWGAVVVPALLAALGMVPMRSRSRRTKSHLALGGVLLTLSLLSLTASFKPEKSGVIGLELWRNLSQVVTGVGSLVVSFVIGAIGIIVLFSTSFEELLAVLLAWSKKIYPWFGNLNPRKLHLKPRPVFVKDRKVPAREPIRIGGARSGDDSSAPPRQAETTTRGEESASKKGLGETVVQNLALEEGIWKLPPLDLLEKGEERAADRGDIRGNAALIEQTLDSFGITARVIEVNLGPAVTQYALEIAMGTKLSKITTLSNDLALALAAPTGQIRIEAPIPGRALVGIEVPNRSLEVVTLERILTSEPMKNAKSKLAFGLGLDVSGAPVVTDLARMPHLLIAGATGSGKSVCINAIICGYLFRATPQEVRFILIDPKRVELLTYNGIAHLLTPVIVELDQALSALKWAMGEMDRRYKLFAGVGARNIQTYNEMSGFQALPHLVIFIDELADLMVFAPAEFEDTVTRLAQMSRATGIHLVLATQRPSTDVITGLIKANIPARIAFAVSSLVDSRVVIDTPGAEKLLGRGDMLFLPPDQAKPSRIQGTFVSDKDMRRLVDYLRQMSGEVEYASEVTEKFAGTIGPAAAVIDATNERDELFEEALALICQAEKASASLLQRRLRIGYARAARILDQLEAAGVVGPPEGSKAREIFIRDPEKILGRFES
jgi:S-DNA-T family DNA segregation ATPase FtsK/SpoIIIE